MIARLGKEIDHPESVYYWAYRNGIPVFCPALTDGSIGDMLYFHSYKRDGLVLDIVADIRAMNDEAISAKPRKTGMLVLGGGDAPDHFSNWTTLCCAERMHVQRCPMSVAAGGRAESRPAAQGCQSIISQMQT